MDPAQSGPPRSATLESHLLFRTLGRATEAEPVGRPPRSLQKLARRFPLPSPPTIGYTLICAVVVVEGATVTSFVTEATTMLVIGFILSMFGIGLFCWLIFTLAVYALPFFVGLTAGMAAFHSGAGVIGALLVGIVAGALTLGIGQSPSRSFARGPSCRHRGRFRRPGSNRRLSCDPRPVADRRAVACLARGLCLDRRDRHRWHGLGTDDRFAEPLPLRPSGASRTSLSRF